MWKGFLLGLLLLVFCPLFLLAAPQDPLLSQATSISSRLREALIGSQTYLQELEIRSSLLQQRLDASENLLEAQAEELQMLSYSLTHTMNSFSALSLELQNSVMQLHTERVRRQRYERILKIIALAGAVILLGKGIFLGLYYGRGIRVPAWLKIIV